MATTQLERPARRVVIAAPAIIGALTTVVLLLTSPWGERNELSYEAVAPIRDAAWTGILLDSVATIAVGFGLSLVVCQLVHTKGAVWAHLGAVLASLGSVLFALGSFAFASLVWHVTEPALLPPAEGAAVMEYAVANPQHAILIQVAGFLTYTAGTLLLCVALLRAATITRWLPIAIIALAVAAFVLPTSAVDYVQAAQALCFASPGVIYPRSTRRSPA